MTYQDEERIKELIKQENPPVGCFYVLVVLILITFIFVLTIMKFEQIQRHLNLPECEIKWNDIKCP